MVEWAEVLNQISLLNLFNAWTVRFGGTVSDFTVARCPRVFYFGGGEWTAIK